MNIAWFEGIHLLHPHADSIPNAGELGEFLSEDLDHVFWPSNWHPDRVLFQRSAVLDQKITKYWLLFFIHLAM